MIDSVIHWALRNRLLVLVAAAAVTMWGAYETASMPVDVFPDLSAPTVTVVAEAHGMAPEEVEQLVAFPIESALNGAAGVRRVRSSTSVGVSVVWVEFEWGADIFQARQIVAEKLQLVQPTLPPDVSPPILAPISSIMGEILFIGLTVDPDVESVSPMDLRTIADWEIRRRLLAVRGVSQVIPIGGGVKQYQVRVRPTDLASYGLTLDEVTTAVRETNENTSAGFYTHGGQEYLIYGVGRVRNVDQIAETVITMREGLPVRIADVATVVIGTAIARGMGGVNGQTGIVMGIQKQAGVNTLALTERLDATLDDLEAGLPEGVTLHRRLLRQADFIQTGVTNVSHALRDGSILVMVIVGLFLFSGRATVITALAIPLSLVVSVLVLSAMGATLNTMTLGGMAIAVGALVDDAIIDVENVVRRLRERERTGVSALTIVFDASKEIRGSIVFATLIIVLVFLPIFFLDGVEGRLLQPLGVSYVVCLAASLLVALTVTPVLCSLLLPGSKATMNEEEPRPVRWLRRHYDRLLERAIAVGNVLLWLSAFAAAGALIAVSFAGRTFLPEFNEGALTIGVVAAPGTSLEESNRMGRRVESILLSHPEVASTALRTGRSELDEHVLGTNVSELEVRLEMQDRSEEEMLSAMRRDFAGVSGVNIIIGQPISHRIDHMMSGTRANIAVKIFGPDHSRLGELAEVVKAEMANVPGVVDLAIEEQANLPLATVRFDRAALARHGLRVHQVAQSIETAFYGLAVSRVLEGAYAFDLVVRYPDEARADLDAVMQTMIPTAEGAWIPLEALADIQRDRGANQISRENGQRKIVVMCNVGDGEDLSGVVGAIRERIADTMPPGYYVEFGGQFEAAEAAARTLLLLGVGVVFGIFLLLFMALSSIRDALLVMMNLPLALIGGVLGVFAAGGVMSIASIIGFITLFGIATRNGIMMITHIRHLMEEEGVTDPHEAVTRGASERLAPILMTALASGLGLLPLALAGGEPGSEIQSPMAVVILFGLISSTILNMLVVPAVMLRFGSIRAQSADPEHDATP